MTIGYHNFKFKALDIIDKILEEEFASITLTPGAELKIPFYFNTILFPYAYAGYGKETTGSTSAWIYGGGIRLLDEYAWRSSIIMTGGAFTFSGYSNSDGENRGTTSFRVGMNIITPLAMTMFEKQANWGAHFIVYFYFNELDFESEEQQPIQINNAYEVAFTLGTQKPMSLLGLEFDRFGLAYRWAEELRAIRLVASFPF